MKREPIECLESWAEELLSRASRVRNLIGSAHWLTDGHYKEELVREYLARHLPNSLRVTRGFICSTEAATRVSPEIDILITDQESELPWFCEAGVVIAPPSAARGQLHVKTEFGVPEIIDVFDSVFKVCESCEPQRDPASLWSGAVFFAHTDCASPNDFTNRIKTSLSRYLADSTDDRRAIYLPHCIAVVDGPILIFDKPRSSEQQVRSVDLRMFTCEKLSVAIILSHFYDSIPRSGRDLHRRGEWTQLLQKPDYEMILQQRIYTAQHQ
jgi:hypothetical protein